MTYSKLDDIQLLLLLKGNDEAAFAEIYSRYWKLLYTAAFKMTDGDDIIKDAVQVVFIALWQRRAETDIHLLKSYLLQAVRFQVLKAIRKQKKEEVFYSALAAITPGSLYENQLLFKEQLAFLKKILNGLLEDCRIIFTMSREDEMTYKQIAAQLNISEKTVEKKMSFSLQQLRLAFRQYNTFAVVVYAVVGNVI